MKFVLIAIFAFQCLFLILAFMIYDNIIWQSTDSMPKGAYLKINIRPSISDIVWFHAPESLRNYFSVSEYWSNWMMKEQNGFMKRVAGIEGDIICDTGDVFTINDKVIGLVRYDLPNAQALPHINGCTRIEHGMIVVASDGGDNGIDSRYFGPISMNNAFKCIPLLTW